MYSSIGGGLNNRTEPVGSTIGGGRNNRTLHDSFPTVSGGDGNIAWDICATVGGGRSNTAHNPFSAIGGGQANYAMDWGAVPGGYADSANGAYSFATNNHSVVATSYSNSAAFNGQAATASSQTRVGQLSKAGGTFTIDHPLDPNGQILTLLRRGPGDEESL